jgi:glucose/arabinose dehydrogenase/PKD repeat protein
MTIFYLYALLFGCLSVVVRSLPDGFIVETVTSEAKGTTGIFAPHPKGFNKPPILLLAEKSGKVSVLENPDESSSTRTILDLDGKTCTDGERGLQSIVVHPNFKKNRFVYLFYAEYIEGCPDGITEGIWNVVNRFTMNAKTLELDYESKREIWRTSRLFYNIHNGGAMAFGNDGKLYITTGDSGRKSLSQPLDNTLGSIIRLNDDGTIPLRGNPYTNENGYEAYRCANSDGRVPETAQNGVCAEVYAHGLRNPFRMRMDPAETEKVRFTISDVGGTYWEELSIGGTDYPGRNYGWPNWEGPCRESSFADCPIPSDELAMEPYHYYQHRSERQGGAVAGSAFVPPGVWPPEYKFLFMDFIFLEIYNLIEAPEQECRSCTPPISGYRNETFYESIQKKDEHVNNARMVDMFFGPYNGTQALYVIRFGEYDTVLRIRYNAIVDNAPPIADFLVSDTKNLLGTKVQFDGSVSSDPDGDDLTFEWDFGDGSKSNLVNPSHQFNTLGEYNVVLKVTDYYGQTQQKTESIVIGNPPDVKIISPAEDDVFYVGELLQLKGEAYDYTGARLDDLNLIWEVRKHHADHFHPFMDITMGNELTLYPAPEPEDYFATTNSYLRIILTAVDKDGLTTQIDRIVKPSLVVVELESNPKGLEIIVDDHTVTTAEAMISWKEHNLRLQVEDQDSYTFQSWSDGNTSRERTIKLSESIEFVKANFCKTNQQSCSNGEECCSGSCVTNVCGTIVDPVIDPAQNLPSLQENTITPTIERTTIKPSLHENTISPTAEKTNVHPSPQPSVSTKESAQQLPTPSPSTAFKITQTTEAPSTVPLFQEPERSSTSDVEIENEDSNSVIVTLLMLNVFLAFSIIPVIVIKMKHRKRVKKSDYSHKLVCEENRSADLEEADKDPFDPFDDCSFNDTKAESSENFLDFITKIEARKSFEDHTDKDDYTDK